MDHVGTTLLSLDGLRLEGTFVAPSQDQQVAGAVLVHGGGVTREEGGFFTRLASGLAEAGIANLRFDLRAHGASEGRMEEMTLSGVVNDIRAAVEHLQHHTGIERVNLLGASFGGGLCAFFAAHYPDQVRRLVLINPLINYKRRFIDDKPHWVGEHLTPEAAGHLSEEGAIPHSTNVRHGRAMLNELFYVRPDQCLPDVQTPTLIIHGTADTFISVESSREAAPRFGGYVQLVEIEGMQHGVAMPDDPKYEHPQTQKWQAEAISRIADWMRAGLSTT